MPLTDIAIATNAGPSSGPPTLKKPPYLVTLERGNGKTLIVERFISLDKPRAENGVIEVKGIFSELSEDEIIKSFADILTATPKELTLEMMFPLHRIVSIRSLVFNADKSKTPNIK